MWQIALDSKSSKRASSYQSTFNTKKAHKKKLFRYKLQKKHRIRGKKQKSKNTNPRPNAPQTEAETIQYLLQERIQSFYQNLPTELTDLQEKEKKYIFPNGFLKGKITEDTRKLFIERISKLTSVARYPKTYAFDCVSVFDLFLLKSDENLNITANNLGNYIIAIFNLRDKINNSNAIKLDSLVSHYNSRIAKADSEKCSVDSVVEAQEEVIEVIDWDVKAINPFNYIINFINILQQQCYQNKRDLRLAENYEHAILQFYAELQNFPTLTEIPASYCAFTLAKLVYDLIQASQPLSDSFNDIFANIYQQFIGFLNFEEKSYQTYYEKIANIWRVYRDSMEQK